MTPKLRVGRLRAGDRLEQQIDRRAALEAGELRGDVGQAARLRRDRRARRSAGRGRAGWRPTVSTDSVAGLTPMTASPQPNSRPSTADEQDAGEVVGRVVGLDADAEHAALAHRVAAARDVADLARGEDQVLVAHQLRAPRRRSPA